VLAGVGTAEDLHAAVDRHQPDLAIVDIRMPPTFTDEGARAARAIKDSHPRIGVPVLSQHIDATHAVTLVSREGFGYLRKDRVLDVDDFMAARPGSQAVGQRWIRRSSAP
jgi:DNA-binding NarL/FixJ family response regulator